MKTNKMRLVAVMPLLAAGLVLVPGAGCGDDITDVTGGLCCTDFNVGADLQGVDFGVDASIAGQFTVFGQAAADVGAIAAASITDIETACRNLAVDFGATEDEQATAKANTKQEDRAKAWCTLAAASIKGAFSAEGKFAAAGTLTVDIQPPVCQASVSASADCSANCQVDANCKADVKAQPPTCEGGKLEVACSGGCKGEAGASVSCQGGCTGTCEGSCTAKGDASVNCTGKCEGTCDGNAQAGEGIQADGTCKGTCKGTCTPSAGVKAECSGSCNGSCSGECKAEAGATVKCDGTCDADFEPLACKGGELKASASCEVNADCDANCSASASAKASCTPPSIAIKASGNVSADVTADFQAAMESLKANLAIIAGIQAKAEGAVKIVGNVSASMAGGGAAFLDPGKLGVKGTACLIPMLGAFATAATQLQTSIDASVTIVTSVTGS